MYVFLLRFRDRNENDVAVWFKEKKKCGKKMVKKKGGISLVRRTCAH